jgi:hypothetical protein
MRVTSCHLTLMEFFIVCYFGLQLPEDCRLAAVFVVGESTGNFCCSLSLLPTTDKPCFNVLIVAVYGM